jgi:hypothetical protein
VIAGKDKGTVAEIEKVLPSRGMVVVKGVNVKVRKRDILSVSFGGQSGETVCPGNGGWSDSTIVQEGKTGCGSVGFGQGAWQGGSWVVTDCRHQAGRCCVA